MRTGWSSVATHRDRGTALIPWVRWMGLGVAGLCWSADRQWESAGWPVPRQSPSSTLPCALAAEPWIAGDVQ